MGLILITNLSAIWKFWIAVWIDITKYIGLIPMLSSLRLIWINKANPKWKNSHDLYIIFQVLCWQIWRYDKRSNFILMQLIECFMVVTVTPCRNRSYIVRGVSAVRDYQSSQDTERFQFGNWCLLEPWVALTRSPALTLVHRLTNYIHRKTLGCNWSFMFQLQ